MILTGLSLSCLVITINLSWTSLLTGPLWTSRPVSCVVFLDTELVGKCHLLCDENHECDIESRGAKEIQSNNEPGQTYLLILDTRPGELLVSGECGQISNHDAVSQT